MPSAFLDVIKKQKKAKQQQQNHPLHHTIYIGSCHINRSQTMSSNACEFDYD
jgi:hypothetical protein